jgi:glutamyl-tRNA reductase
MRPAPGKELVLVGASHRTAGVTAREAAGVPKERLKDALASWRGEPEVEELFILSTCNRTEVVAVGPDADRLEARLRAVAFERLPAAATYALRGAEAIFHLFSVCAGLRSMVIGEHEIQGQFKEAMQAAHDEGALGPHLEALLRQALRAGKRVRTETAIGEGALSVASAAAELVSRVSTDFAKLSALVVGAGETGVAAAKNLAARGVVRLTFANRTLARAVEAAAPFGARAASLDGLPALAAEHDVIVVCVEAPEPLFTAARLKTADWRASETPKVFVDLSVPRAVAADVGGFRDALVFDLDAIESATAAHREARRAELDRADRILVDEVHKFLAFRTYAAISPALTELGAKFEEVRAAWLAAHSGDARLDEASQDLLRRLLAASLAHVKDAVRLVESSEALERAYRRYVERIG